jgi:alpha,alpha-trehalose phosphorylase
MRGNLDEGEPFGLPGTYLGGFYESRELPYAEAGFGYPEAGQTVVNVTNGKIIRLLVEDEPFDIRYGNLVSHERCLDLRAGVLHRRVEWESPTGRRVRVSSTRLVSFTHRAVAAVLYEVEPLDEAFPVVVQSELVANEALPEVRRSSPARTTVWTFEPSWSTTRGSVDSRWPRPWTTWWRDRRALRPGERVMRTWAVSCSART